MQVMSENRMRKIGKKRRVHSWLVRCAAAGLTAVAAAFLYGMSAGAVSASAETTPEQIGETAQEQISETAPATAGAIILMPEEEIIISPTEDTEAEQELETESPIDFESLRAKNPDIYSWIRIPGTVIDYPVLRSTGYQEFYLHHDADGNESVYGSIFSQSVNRKDYTDFLTVLYGHNMRDYSMFGSLKLFQESSVMQNNKYIYIYLPEITLRYEIFAAYSIEAVHPLYQFDQEDMQDHEDYLEQVEERGASVSTFDRELFETITKDSHILSLYTCNGNPDYRFVVQGVLDEPEGGWTELAIELGLREPPKKPARLVPYTPVKKAQTDRTASGAVHKNAN